MLAIILASVSTVVGFSTTIGIEDLDLLGKLVYAQSGTNNTSSLPPVQLEPVDPNNNTNSATGVGNSSDYTTYTDSDIGFKIDYPSEWEVGDKDLTNNAVIAFSPPDGSTEVDVKLYPRTNSQSLKSFGDQQFKNSNNFRISAYYRNGTTLLGGEPAVRAVGTFINSPGIFQNPTTEKVLAMTTLLKEQKSFLQVIYYADKSNFMDYLPQVEHMIKSFQFQNAKPVIQEED